MFRTRYLVTPVAALALVSGISGTSQPAQAVPAAIKDCTEPKGLGNKTPVILVHGLFSKGDSWKGGGEASMYATLKKMSGVYVEVFDYKDTNTAWVTSDNIGPRLSRRIACLAAHSRDNKGLGKVIGVGHSMGGRALEFASGETVNNRKTSEDLAHIVTIGTPYQGSLGGNAMESILYAMCNPVAPVGKVAKSIPKHGPCNNEDGFTAFSGLGKYSEEGKKLPDFPKSLPVQAIAGDVTLQSQLVKTPFDWHTNSDLVVGVGSAFDNETYKQEGILVKCHEHIITRPDCWHSALTSNEKVKQAVVDTVSKYVTKTLSAEQLNLKVPLNWTTGNVFGGHGKGVTGVKTGSCIKREFATDCQGFEVHGPQAISYGAGPSVEYTGSYMWTYSSGTVGCPENRDEYPAEGDAKKLKQYDTTVSGRKAVFAEWQTTCFVKDSYKPGIKHIQRTWWVPSLKTLVVDEWKTNGLDKILRDATWSTPDLSNTGFVGEWRVHTETMTISKDGLGLDSWNYGSCDSTSTTMCRGHATIRFKQTGDGLKGTVLSVYYRDDEGNEHAVEYFDSGPQVGDTLFLKRHETGVIKRNTSDTEGGNPYLCSQQASSKWLTECNTGF